MMNGMACCSGVGGIVGMVLAGLLGLALLALLVLGTVWLARALRTAGAVGSGDVNEAVEIARREYAGGRIDRDEFLRRSADLTDNRA